MSDLYRTVKRLPSTDLAAHGFRHDRLKEGFFKTLPDGRSISFLVNGMWSHVELFASLRFADLNDLLIRSARRAGWPKEREEMFRLELIGLFLEKIDDFCASEEDIGKYCPSGSIVASPAEIGQRVLIETDRLSSLASLEDALRYVCDRSLFEPLGAYMIPAGARLTGDSRLWNWSVDRFASSMPDEQQPSYRALLQALEEIGGKAEQAPPSS